MKLKFFTAAVTAFCFFTVHVSIALGQGATAFTYQGHLLNNGANVNGTNGLIFTLYPAITGGAAVTTPITNSVAVSNGLFTVNLDFGAGAFNGGARWLDIAVSNGTANVELSQRTQVLPTPYATFAATAGSAGTASNYAGGLLEGSFFGNGGGLTNVGVSLQMQVFPSPGTFTFTVPTNVSTIVVEAWGGGGGGASGSASYDVGGGGGGAGGYGKVVYNVTPGTSYQVNVGAGGLAEATGGSSGMGGVVISTGGSPGNSPTSTTSHPPGGAGGTGPGTSGTSSSAQGGTGKYGTTSGGGDGGDTPCGGPGGLGNLGSGAEAGHFPGGGGGGGEYFGITAGAAGGSGEVIVHY